MYIQEGRGRIALRFFGGWEFEEADVQRPHMARIGYRKGVPMGGELPAAASDASPARPGFLILASKDPQGANLDRVQVVKGWLEADGSLREKVYTVAASDGREIGRDGRVAPLRSTVDLARATYRNSIGAAQLGAYWEDPAFDPGQRAFYYARVIEIPTPRWSTYDAVRLGQTLNPDDPRIVQDRAYSSPIWYTP